MDNMERLNEQDPGGWARHIRETAASFPYPATPDMTGAVQQRLAARPMRPMATRKRLAWAIVLILLIFGGLMAVPQVRAAVVRMIRAGAIAIFITEPTPAVPPLTKDGPLSEGTSIASTPPPRPADEFIFELAEPVPLAEAQNHTQFPLRLPAYPEDLGPPDHVYLQELDRQVAIIMVWLNPTEAGEPQMSLYHIEGDDYAYKGAERIEFTSVNGREAFWLEAPHLFRLQNGRDVPWLFVEGNVLIWWTPEGVTYRLESGLSLAEALRIAESLK